MANGSVLLQFSSSCTIFEYDNKVEISSICASSERLTNLLLIS